MTILWQVRFDHYFRQLYFTKNKPIRLARIGGRNFVWREIQNGRPRSQRTSSSPIYLLSPLAPSVPAFLMHLGRKWINGGRPVDIIKNMLRLTENNFGEQRVNSRSSYLNYDRY